MSRLYSNPSSPDLHGRGYSEITKTPSDVNLYTIQLALLLQYVGWHNAYIVGFSMVYLHSHHILHSQITDFLIASQGGGIAAAFAYTFPHLVNGRVVFLASAGLIEVTRSLLHKDLWAD